MVSIADPEHRRTPHGRMTGSNNAKSAVSTS
jgi:hypothetical protein